MKNHLCILFCYQNVDHIKQCYESLSMSGIDFFVVENVSDASEEIRRYFSKLQNVIGHIRFDTNITYKALETFFSNTEFYTFCGLYEYISVTDCDILLKNTEESWKELKCNLEYKNVCVSCIDLSMENFPVHVPGSSTWLPEPIKVTDQYIECYTGVHLLTIKNRNLNVLRTRPFIDVNIANTVRNLNLKWVKTRNNKAIHLTWDLYVAGNDYYEYKLKNLPHIWNHSLTSEYTILK